MTFDYGALTSSLNQLVAAEAVASARVARVARRAAHENRIAHTTLAAEEKNSANAMKMGAGYVQIAQSAASTAQATVKAGQAGADLAQQQQQQPAVTEAYGNWANAAPEQREEAMASLREVPLGSGTVGDRYTDEQIEALGGDARTAEEFGAAGFTEDESRELAGLSPTERHDPGRLGRFMTEHRRPPAEVAAASKRDQVIETVESQFTEALTKSLGYEADRAEERKSRHQALADHAHQFAGRITEDAIAHEQRLGDIQKRFADDQAKGV